MWKYLVLQSILFSVGNTQTNNEDARNCICVMYYLCDTTNYTIITNGLGIIDVRAGFPKCEQSTHLCCTLNNRSLTPKPLPQSSSCGIRNPDGVGHKIVSSDSDRKTSMAEFGEFPWMVAILKSSGAYRCGGSLIHPSVVLTAAHCVLQTDTYTVRAGEWDSSNTAEIISHQDRKVSTIKIHEDYIPGILHNDIALLYLSSPFDLAPHINVVCLPPANIIADGKCFISGWGREQFGNKTVFPVILKEIELPIVPRDKCQEDLRKTRLGQLFHLHQSFVCAGGNEGEDACVGDGGSPLVCPIDEEETQYQQIGIVSWGIGCGAKNIPGVYTNVPLFRQWIEKQMKLNNYEIPTVPV